MWTSSVQYPTGTAPNEESGPLANNTPLTGFEPNHFDDDAELSDETIGRALSSPLFTQEREEPCGP